MTSFYIVRLIHFVNEAQRMYKLSMSLYVSNSYFLFSLSVWFKGSK